MAITAKVKCVARVSADLNGDHDVVRFQPDYDDDRNKEWAKYTPALSLSMNVRKDVPFEVGTAYTLTFEPSAEA